MTPIIYGAIGSVLAAFIGLTIFAGVIVETHRKQAFFTNGENIKWFAYVFIWAITGPIMYWWGSPVRMSLPDAFLLRVTGAGWTYVLMGYAALLGLVLGVLVTATVHLIKKNSK